MQGSLAERLRVLRARRGYTLAEAAEKTGVDRGTLSSLERGVHTPYTPTLHKIAKGYDVPVEDLLEEERPLSGAPSPSPETAGAGTLAELLANAGVETRWLTKPQEDFDAWWHGVSRDEAIRRFWQIEDEYRAVVAEWQAIHAGEPTATPELQREIRDRMFKFFGQHFAALAAAPGVEETPEEFYERQRSGRLRQFKQHDLDDVRKDIENLASRGRG